MADVDAGGHPGWCDAQECQAALRAHPDAGLPAHRSRRLVCDPTGRETVGVAVQLARLVELPDRDFLRVVLTLPDEAVAYHVELTQGRMLAGALPQLVAMAAEADRAG